MIVLCSYLECEIGDRVWIYHDRKTESTGTLRLTVF